MPRYGDGPPYHFGNSFSNHSSLMTTTGSGRLHGPLVSRYSPHLSTISESPLTTLRRYSPVITSSSRPKRVDTADIDVSTPRNLAHTDNHGRNKLRRDRPTVRIRSQALKDNPALRELNEKHEKTVGELLVEKFLIRDKGAEDPIKMVKVFHQPSLERTANEATQKKVTRRLTRRRSSLEMPTDSEIIAREVIIAQAQAEALDSLVEQEQAQIKVEARRRTITKRSMSRDSISVPSGSSDNELCANEETERPSSTKKTLKKMKKKKKTPSKTLSQSEDVDEKVTEKPHLKQSKSDGNLILQGQPSHGSGEEKSRIRPQKFKIEACNSVGDFSTLWINASSAPTSPISTEQFRESIRLPAPKSNKDTSLTSVINDDQSETDDDMVVVALPKRYLRDSTRNSVHLTLKTATQEPTITRNRKIDNTVTSIDKDSPIEQLVNSRYSTKQFNNVNSIVDQLIDTDNSKNVEQSEIMTTSSLEILKNCSNATTNASNVVVEEAEVQSKTAIKKSDISKLPKKVMKKSNSQFKDISVKNEAQNLSDVPNLVSQVSVPPTEINDISVPEAIVQQPLNDVAELSKSVENIVKVGTNSEFKVIAENLPDNVSKPSKKPLKKSNSELKDVSVTKASNNISDVPDPVSEISFQPTKINGLSVPEMIADESLNNIAELSKPIQDTKKFGTSSALKVISENLLDNASKLPKKLIKKSNSQLEVRSPKNLSHNFNNVPNPIPEVSVLPIKTNDVSVPNTTVQQSSNDIAELSKPTQDIVKVSKNFESKAITENLLSQSAVSGLGNMSESIVLSPPISEVDFWGEIDREGSPITTKSKLSLQTDNSVSVDLAEVCREEVDTDDKKLVLTMVEDTVIPTETELNENSKFKDVAQICNKESSGIGKRVGEVPVSEINESPEDKACAKGQDVSEGTNFNNESVSQIEDTDELPTPTPATEERITYPILDPPLPTINIVAAPTSPEANGVESTPDDDPSTPTNEWPNASLTMSKWVSQNDLSDATEVDKEATPTPPSGADLGVSPQSSKKKKLVKKKKPVIKKSESEDNGSMDNSQKATKPVPEKSPVPSEQNSPKCSLRSSPRNSPKQRPIDLIRMFYTTPGPLLTATPRDLSKVRRGGRRRKRNLSTTSSASDSTESARSTQSTTTESTEDTSSTCTEGAEEAKDEKRLTSTRSNDSGFDGSPRLTNCDMACHKKCEKLTGNLCGLNQKLVAEALQALKRAPSQSSDSQRSEKPNRFQASGRITPPATNLPRFKKYAVTDFNFLKVLGKGSFGKVLLAELRDTDCLYAVKCLKKDVVLEDDDVECTLIERKVLTLATRHPYLCHLFCTFQTDSHLFFVMEYLNGGDLMFHIQRAGRFPEPRARFYAAEILSGLTFLHKKGIVYRDLKLDNVLLDFDGHIRIADFGMCKLQIYLDRTADTFCGTPDYMAPEIIKGMKYNQAVDWWSYGVLLYEMLTGQSPFSGCDEDELFWSICNERPFIPRYLTQEATDILVCLLEKDAGKRLPGHEITIHPFFQALPWDRLERRQLEPPFKPALEHTLDTRYFDSTFTAERPRLSIVPEQILISMDQGVFRGFSYTNPNATD